MIKTGCLLVILMSFKILVFSQDQDLLISDPRAYVEQHAVEASIAQQKAQQKILTLNDERKSLTAFISKLKDPDLKKSKVTELDSLDKVYKESKIILKLRIAESKKYRSLLAKSNDEIIASLSNSKLNHSDPEKDKIEDSVKNADQNPPKENITSLNNAKNPTKKERNKRTAAKSTKIKSKKEKQVQEDIISKTAEVEIDEKKARNIETKSSKSDKLVETNDNYITPHSIEPECIFYANTITGHISVASEVLFTYTPPEIKDYIKGFDYSIGTAYLGHEPGFKYFSLSMEISSDQALFQYGNLNKSFIIFRLVNGKEVRLINSKFDSGNVNRDKKKTTLSGVFYIDKEAEKLLATVELDLMKLQMVTGYEEYTIYNVDFFKRQFQCLNSSK